MGWKPPTYRLVFQGDQYDGLQVVMRGMTIEQLAQVTHLTSLGTDLLLGAAAEQREQFLALLAAGLKTWNVEDDDDQPVPTTLSMVSAQDFRLLLAIAGAWIRAVAGVSDPLEPSSSGGPSSAEASLPMEVLSPSPPS